MSAGGAVVPAAGGSEAGSLVEALAWWADHRHGDDRAAAVVLAGLLRPTATRACRRLLAGPALDAEVAAALWLEVRTAARPGRRSLAATIVGNVRAQVLANCRGPRRDRRRLLLVPDYTGFDRGTARGQAEPGGAGSRAELVALLDWAVTGRVITAGDRVLLWRLVAAAHDTDGDWGRRGTRQGLLSGAVTGRVATQAGLSARTVRRHAQAAIDALAAARGRYWQGDPA